MTTDRRRRSPGAGAPVPPAPTSLRPWTRVAAVVAVLVIGSSAAVVTYRRAAHDAAQREELLAEQTASVAASTVQQLLAAISGVAGLPDASGGIDEMAFRSYARGAVEASPFDALAYTPVVDQDERAAFEDAIGGPVTDLPGGTPAPRRATYLPVQWVAPDDVGQTQDLVGTDLAVEDVRRQAAEAARDSGRTVISETVAARPSGAPSVFVIHPVYMPDTPADATVGERRDAILGFVTTGVIGTALLDAVDAQVGDAIAIRIEDVPAGGAGGDGVVPLAETDPGPTGGTTAERAAGGRGWRVTVDDRVRETTGAAWWVLAATAGLALALAALAVRARRYERDVARHVETMERIAELARGLAAADSVDDVRRVAAADAAPALGAEAVRLVTEDASGAPASLVEIRWPPPGDPPDDLARAGVVTVTGICRQALARARLADETRRDAITSHLLAGLAEAAATAGTVEEVARSLLGPAADVPGAETSDIVLLSDDGRALVPVDPGPDGTRPPTTAVDPGDPGAVATAWRSAAPVLLDDAGAAHLPLRADDGTALGVLSLGWPEPQRFDQDLVDVLTTTADLCASSLARARETDRARESISTMASLAGALATARTFDDVGRVIIRSAAAAIGADIALLGLFVGDRFHLLAPSGPGLDVLAPYSDTPLAEFPAHPLLLAGQTVTFSALGQVPDEGIAGDLAAAGLEAGVLTPLVDRDGTVSGVFIALWSQPPDVDDALHARLATVAEVCAQSIERSRLFDAEHRLHSDLERSVLADAPEVPGLDVATRYRPASTSVGMGGDWYDAIALDGGRVCLVVGDVSGHGVAAVAAMTQVRTVVHTLIAGGMALPEVLQRTSEVMQRDALGYATALLATIDPRAGTMVHVSAGHPPGLLRGADGAVVALRGGRHPVLGIDVAARTPARTAFPVGATLVLYTDGLVERRGTPIDESIDALRRAVGAADRDDADGLADHLLGLLATSATDDDVAVVVARRTG